MIKYASNDPISCSRQCWWRINVGGPLSHGSIIINTQLVLTMLDRIQRNPDVVIRTQRIQEFTRLCPHFSVPHTDLIWLGGYPEHILGLVRRCWRRSTPEGF